MSKTLSNEEVEIIKNYAKNCGFKECKTWDEINECFSELRRKNNALIRNLPENSSWNIINDYDNYYNCSSYFNSNNNKYRKIDLVPEKYSNNYYYNTCD